MGRFTSLKTRRVWSVFLGATLLAGSVVAPAAAADFTYNCAPGEADTGTVTLNLIDLGISGSELDGTDSELDFGYEFTVTRYDPAQPGWTGPQLCSYTYRWEWDVNEPNVIFDMNPFPINRRVVIEDVPRKSRVHFSLFANERDTFDEDDWADFNPAPGGSPRVELDIFVEEGKARTMIGAAQGTYDVGLGALKRVQGDGRIGADHDHFRAYVDFIADVQITPLMTMIPVDPNVVNPNLGALLQFGNICKDYADKAVQMSAEAQNLGCGFQFPVWSTDYNHHYNWCMHGANIGQVDPANIQRASDLSKCTAEKAAQPKPNLAVCAIYATQAVVMAGEAQGLGCGFGGPRWVPDYNAHFAWCMAGAPAPALVSEAAARGAELAGCAAAKGN